MIPLRIVIFAKAPAPGLAKTRLIPALGTAGSARLARQLINHTVAQALDAAIGPVEICVTPDEPHDSWEDLTLPSALHWSVQGDGDLGQRMARAAQRVIEQGESILLIGTDCPQLTAEVLRLAAAVLTQYDTCLVPVSDGGYGLLGLNHYIPTLFSDIPWSTASVAALTQQRILEAGLSLKPLPTLHDIDEPQDLQWLPLHWHVVP